MEKAWGTVWGSVHCFLVVAPSKVGVIPPSRIVCIRIRVPSLLISEPDGVDILHFGLKQCRGMHQWCDLEQNKSHTIEL